MPETGRWITRDPAGFVDGPNLYAYVHGNPMRYYDPYGLWSIEGAMESVRDLFSGFCSGSNNDGSMSGGDIAMSGACVVAAPFLFEGGAVAATAFAVFEVGVAAVYTGNSLYDCVGGDRFSKGRADTAGADVKVPEASADGVEKDSVEPSKERGKRRKNWLLEETGNPGEVEWNKPGTAGRKNGDDGWPEIEFNEGHQGKKRQK
jgi:uncharacterized protein RhaS with RHS repeats